MQAMLEMTFGYQPAKKSSPDYSLAMSILDGLTRLSKLAQRCRGRYHVLHAEAHEDVCLLEYGGAFIEQ